MSVALGQASNSNALQLTYTNLVDAYVLVGRGDDAFTCMERAREWLVPKRRWKFHCGFLTVRAAFELIRGNTPLALDIIEQMEALARDREQAVPIPGSYWKLRIFRSAHLDDRERTERLVRLSTALFRERSPLNYLDVLAAKAWFERLATGENSVETRQELDIFENVGAVGRKALLTVQGFLSRSDNEIETLRQILPRGGGVRSATSTA